MPYKDKERLREYQRNWVASRRASYFAGKVCVQCGTSHNLELDHIDPAQKVTHRIWTWAQHRQEEELAKCQVLCQECHKVKTADDLSKPITHGNSGYDRGCRCDVCFVAHSERMKLRMR